AAHALERLAQAVAIDPIVRGEDFGDSRLVKAGARARVAQPLEGGRIGSPEPEDRGVDRQEADPLGHRPIRFIASANDWREIPSARAAAASEPCSIFASRRFTFWRS